MAIPNPGLKSSKRILFGLETTEGTPVAVTDKYVGSASMPIHDVTITHPEVDTGTLGGETIAFQPRLSGGLTLDSMPMTFEQAPWILNMAIDGVTSVADGGGSGFVRTYAIEQGSSIGLSTYTVQAGDDVKPQKVSYCFAPDFTIAGEKEGPLTIEGNVIGQQWTDIGGPFTVVATPSVEFAQFGYTALYIDDVDTAVGTTQMTNNFLSFSLAMTYNRANFTGEGDKIFWTFPKRAVVDWVLTFTLETDAQSYAERLLFDRVNPRTAISPRAIRLLCEGSSLTTPGSYSRKTFDFKGVGIYESVEPGDEENNNTLTFTVRLRNDATFDSTNSLASAAGEIVVVNEVQTTALP
jgi:hypothetical protein